MILSTINQEEYDTDVWLRQMSHVFIGMRTIMFLDKVYTFLVILMRIIFVLGGFWKLRCGKILSNTYSTSK